jgi:hypothetical protein
MKSALFAKPNLKLFLLGAVLIAVVHDLITNGHSQSALRSASPGLNASVVPKDDLKALLKLAAEQPSAEAYCRISHYYEKRGDYKNALHYLRRAEQFEPPEDVGD